MTWFKTSDERPEQFVAVLAYFNGMYYAAFMGDDETWRMDEDNDEATTPTHWMPLPEPPK